MAVVTPKLVIEVDPNRPKEEIINVILAFLKLYPGSEAMILKAVQKEIDGAILLFEKGAEANANDVSRNGEQSGNGTGGIDHSSTDDNNRT